MPKNTWPASSRSSREVNLAYWTATISGQPADFERYASLEVELQKVYSNREDFARLEAWKKDGRARNAVEARQLDLVHRAYLRNQVDPELIEATTRLSSQIVRAFGTYRVRVDGHELTGNDVRTVLKTSIDSSHRARGVGSRQGGGPGRARRSARAGGAAQSHRIASWASPTTTRCRSSSPNSTRMRSCSSSTGSTR